MYEKITNIPNEYIDSLSYSKSMVNNHSMGKYLKQYLEMKVHHVLKNITNENEVIIVPKFSRNNIISNIEKTDKLFNYMRPTVKKLGKTYIVECYPGIDYLFHYFCILKGYFQIEEKNIEVKYSFPNSGDCLEELAKSNLSNISKSDIVILGYVVPFSNHDYNWEGTGVSKWKKFEVRSGRSAILLGCEHTYWGDIAGHLVSVLAQMGVKTVIYVGKLGGLKIDYVPNISIATGNMSFIPSIGWIEWNNIFSKNDSPVINEGVHITIPSVLQETDDWLESISKDGKFDFVDPEIGHMARAANNFNINFSFLHIISDNLILKHEENLSNERNQTIKVKRESLLDIINHILYNKL
ncbi:hypothetical protein [Streptococcus suis]